MGFKRSDDGSYYDVYFTFDDTEYPGANSGDGCAFFDAQFEDNGQPSGPLGFNFDGSVMTVLSN